MSMMNFIHAMPKVELNLRLEGAFHEGRLLAIAEYNEIEESLKHFRTWVELIKKPDYGRIHELIPVIVKWLQQPDDLAHIVYELGVTLAKQNVRYAEICVTPSLFVDNGFTFESLMSALNDGRDRAERGWGIRIGWILAISRDNPRSADEIVRWVTSAPGRKGGVVGLGLVGKENIQPIGQFERAFRTAEKKEVPRLPTAGDELGAEGIRQAVENLAPNRIADGWGAAESPDVIDQLIEQHIPLAVFMARALRAGQVERYQDYPLRRLIDEGVEVVIGTGMPSLYKTTLEEEYYAAVEYCGLSLEELETVALNAVRASYLPAAEKEAMLADFQEAYANLRTEHLSNPA